MPIYIIILSNYTYW